MKNAKLPKPGPKTPVPQETPLLERIWHTDPDLVREFFARKADYEQLCAEVTYTLTKRIREADIKISMISSRAKTLESFIEKIRRKSYKEPFRDATDLSGVRVVCLYPDDVQKVIDLVEQDFDVISDEDKLAAMLEDQFGYVARHLIIRLGKKSSGARYDDLKHLVCEVQVRTVAQDAWAAIAHHLVYKKESQIPRSLKRALSSLAGVFETADREFEKLRTQRESYINEVRWSSQIPDRFLENELNYDSLEGYLLWKYPNRAVESWNGQLRFVFDVISEKYEKLRDIDDIVKRTEKDGQTIKDELVAKNELPPTVDDRPSTLDVVLAISLQFPELMGSFQLNPVWQQVIRRRLKREA
jgi:ppGpp synthetase/RelA/SpoT-type nucleotidyltranferase